MSESLIVQGRRLEGSELANLRQWVREHPDWSRRRLSVELASRWGWHNRAGRLKDMAARTLLVKLHQRGLIVLPPRRQAPTNRMRCPAAEDPSAEESPEVVEGALPDLGRLEIQEVSQDARERTWFKRVLGHFHYLGFNGTIGENLQYFIRDGRGRRLAVLVFGAAAWKCQPRDQFIGWSPEQRQRNLALLVNNTRFLILPWVHVRCLGSWSLSQISARIAADWQAKYGHEVVLLESFVQRERFRGTVYRAANWLAVGATTGRTRQDRHTCLQAPVKDIYLYPLRGNFREALRA